MAKKVKIGFAFFILIAYNCFSQTSYKVTNYTSRQGLSNSSIYNIEKDSSGFLWIATELGINKFDGKNFYRYTPNSHNIPDNTVVSILPIGNNKFFCTTGTSGYFIFDSKEEKPLPLSVSLSPFAYKAHKVKCDGNMVYIKANFSNYILVFSLKSNAIVDTIKVDKTEMYDYEKLSDGSILIASRSGLKCWNKGTLSDYALNGFNHPQTPINAVYDIGNLLCFSKGGYVFMYDKTSDSVRDSVKYEDSDIPINKLLRDGQGNIWFSRHYPAGVFQYNPVTKQLRDFSFYLNGVENSVASIIEDVEKNIWVGTYSSGLYKIAPSVFKPVNVFRNENVYYANLDDAKRFFIGARTGLNILDIESNSVENISIDKSNNSYIYAVTKAKGKFVVLNNKSEVITYSHDKTKFHFINKRSICMINDTIAIVGGWSNGLQLINLSKDSLRVVASTFLKSSDGSRNRINCLLLDSKNSLWCGTDAGLYMLSTDLKRCKKIECKLFTNTIVDILEDGPTVYVATRKGLVAYANGQVKLIKEINNHPVDKINSICKDKQGSIFLGTLNGLFKVRPNGFDTYFDVEDGLVSKEINKIAYNPYTNSILVATNEGLSEFNLYQFKYLGKNIPKIHFDKITSTGEVTYNSGEYYLSNRNVNIYFGTIGFRHASSINFRWRMDGGDYHYILNPSIEFAAMTYGRHTIEIYASNDGKSWSQPLILKVNINTPFYRTTWFILLAGVLGTVVVILLFKIRIAKVSQSAKKKSELEQKIVYLKYEALNASINPHFIFNALNSVQHYINTNRNDEASDYLAKFGFLIRQTLENASEHFISIKDEIERLKMYMDLEKLRFNDGFAYEIKIDPAINVYKSRIPNMILQPLIENSIVHGFKQIAYLGYIRVQFQLKEQELFIVIEDNGQGLRSSQNKYMNEKVKHKSIALQNVKERIKTVPNASIKIADKAYLSGKDTGVLIEISLPINL